MSTLTKKEFERQDFVDNQIYELMQTLIPSNVSLRWNIEEIGAIRDVLEGQIVDEHKVMDRAEFYP